MIIFIYRRNGVEKVAKEEITKNELVPVFDRNDEYKKSNFIISSMYKSSLFENKIMAISLSRVQIDSESGKIFSKMKAGEIRKLLKTNAGSFYAQLDRAANHLTGKSIGMSNPVTQEFDYIAIITRATYRNSELTIYFNSDLKDYIYNIKNNFTWQQLPLMLSFKNLYAYRLYEILRSRAYFPKNMPHDEDSIFKISFPLAELKFNLGLADVDDDNVKKILKNKKHPDYDMALEVAQDKMFDRWCDFKLYVLEQAIEEINSNTDLIVDYKQLGKGRGGKVHQIDFYVDIKGRKKIADKEEEVAISQDDKDSIIEEIMYMNASERLRLKDATAIAEAAEWNLDKVRNAFEIFKNAKNVNNVTGFLISAIKDDYQQHAQQEVKVSKNMFNNFQQRSFEFEDFESFEKNILAN